MIKGQNSNDIVQKFLTNQPSFKTVLPIQHTHLPEDDAERIFWAYIAATRIQRHIHVDIAHL